MRVAIVLCLMSCAANAQWITLKTPGVPRDKAGNLLANAKAPRTAQGKPDFSGLWKPAETLPCPKMLTDDSGECLEKNPIGQLTADMDKVVPGGVPLNEWGKQTRKQRQEHGLDPHVLCMPSNFPRMYALPHITKFVQTPKLLMLANEFNATYRQIFMDGRALPEDPQPSWNGYSTAHWEGDTLVVESNGYRDDLWMDMQGTPLTHSAKVTERIRRPTFGTLTIDATIDDMKAYTKPWTVRIGMSLVIDTEQIDEFCLENEKSSAHMK